MKSEPYKLPTPMQLSTFSKSFEHKFSSLFIIKLLLNVNLKLKCVFISLVIYLDKASNSRYKYSNEYAQRLHYSLFGQSGFYLVSIFIKNKAFQSEALKKMFSLSPFMEEFGRHPEVNKYKERKY